MDTTRPRPRVATFSASAIPGTSRYFGLLPYFASFDAANESARRAVHPLVADDAVDVRPRPGGQRRVAGSRLGVRVGVSTLAVHCARIHHRAQSTAQQGSITVEVRCGQLVDNDENTRRIRSRRG